MKIIKRNNCIIDDSNDFELLQDLKKFPVFMGCVSHPEENDITANLTWKISKSSGTIQLSDLIPLDILYQQEHSSGVVGRIWHDHHQAFANFINKFNPDSIFEIGGLHGILADKYHKSFKEIPWNILEPNPIPLENTNASFEKGFFDENYKPTFSFDTIVHSHVFEHVYEPKKFLLNISNLMKEGQKLIFSVPNMKEMLKRKYTNCLNFEHTVFLTENLIDNLLSKSKFKILSKKIFLEDHSIFYCVEKCFSVKELTQENPFLENKKIFEDFLNYHRNLIDQLNYEINSSTQSVFLFGAHVFAQYLILSGLNTSKISYILDNDFNKHNKRLYGTNLYVKSPQILASEKKPLVVLKAGVYNSEIKEDILKNINSDTIFLE